MIWRVATYASAFLLLGMSIASAQEACPRGQRVQQLEMLLQFNRNHAQIAAQHGAREDARAYFDEATRISAEIPYAYLDQEIASFPLFRNARCMLIAYGTIVGHTVSAEERQDHTWTLYVVQDNERHVARDHMTDQQLLSLVRVPR